MSTPPRPAMTEWDLAALSPAERYRLMTSVVVPRPIALVSTRGADGSDNLAPFSYFNAVATEPPIVMLSVSNRRHSDGRSWMPKDTLRNLRETRECVIHVVGPNLLDPLHASSAELAYGESEFDRVGLTREPSTRVAPPRVAEAPIALEGRLEREIALGGEGGPFATVLVLIELVWVRVTSEWVEGGSVQPERVDAIARLGGSYYSRLGEKIARVRPSAPTTGR